MRKAISVPLPLLTVLALLVVPPVGAGAKSKSVTVSGKISRGKGMTLVAQTPKGASRSVRLRGTSFRLKLPGVRGTRLQLLGADGKYAGPVILGRAGKRRAYGALSGKRSVRLGKLRRGKGFYAARKVARKGVSTRRKDLVKLTKGGAPVGAGRLGFRPRKKKRATRQLGAPSARASQSQLCEPGADADQDGIPNSLDADASGNGILNIVDWEHAGNTQFCPTNTFVNTWYDTGAVNLNSGMTKGDVDTAVRDFLLAAFGLRRNAVPGQTINKVTVACALTPWCQTATFNFGTGDNWKPREAPLWSSRGFQLISNREINPDPGPGMNDPDWFGSSIRFGASPSQISPYDAIVYEAHTGQGAPVLFPDILGPYFVTSPAVARITTAKGTVHDISYPLKPGDPGANAWTDEQGAHQSATPIALDDTTVTFTLWRPQRPAIAGAETGEWRDMGGLRYRVDDPSGAGGSFGCPLNSYSNLSATLKKAEPRGQEEGGAIEDTAGDAEPSPGNTMSFTIDFAACAGGSQNLPNPTRMQLGAENSTGANAAGNLMLSFPQG